MDRTSHFRSVDAIASVAINVAERQLAGPGGAGDPRVLQALHTAATLLAQRAGASNSHLQQLLALVFQITATRIAPHRQDREEGVLP